MIRKVFIDRYKASGKPPTEEEVALQLGIAARDVKDRIRNEPRLPNIHEISFDDARILIEFYGPDFMFVDSVVSDVKAYFAHRAKIEEFERKARRKQDPPKSSDKK